MKAAYFIYGNLCIFFFPLPLHFAHESIESSGTT